MRTSASSAPSIAQTAVGIALVATAIVILGREAVQSEPNLVRVLIAVVLAVIGDRLGVTPISWRPPAPPRSPAPLVLVRGDSPPDGDCGDSAARAA